MGEGSDLGLIIAEYEDWVVNETLEKADRDWAVGFLAECKQKLAGMSQVEQEAARDIPKPKNGAARTPRRKLRAWLQPKAQDEQPKIYPRMKRAGGSLDRYI